MSKRQQEVCQHEYEYFKQIMVFKNGGKSFHYKEKCQKCGKSHFIKRTKEVYDLVKEKPWIISKKSRIKIKQQKLWG